MEISEDLLCVFAGEVEEQGDSYVIEVPRNEVTIGELDGGGTYRVALLSVEDAGQPEQSDEDRSSDDRRREVRSPDRNRGPSDQPVAEGEQHTVEIEDIGEKGDGIARVDRGFVVIVPDTELRERVTIEITDVTETVAFGEVVERQDYYE
ncbi:TRAM domain-containing protein [Halorarum halophilum]|uniref:TRAM domain-containing protein n=1 Tax=Halorarum halophilum TaxID=2743090 RepID=A0A7D5KMU3_9EURY|nr:TRAM domain-containing protein [Halobaculum halophilum]QLG28695.1 TRAM domain-containing protein [Halobaculum halophilum]